MVQEFDRSQRVADFLMRELAQLIQRSLRDPRIGMVSVNDVEVSRDLAHARVYVSFMEAASGQEARPLVDVLNRAAGFMRTEIARRSTMRTVPRLRFHYDASSGQGRRLSKLIEEAVATDRSRRMDSNDDANGEE